MNITLDEKCSECNTNLREVNIEKYSDKWKFCRSCPKCHIIFDLVEK